MVDLRLRLLYSADVQSDTNLDCCATLFLRLLPGLLLRFILIPKPAAGSRFQFSSTLDAIFAWLYLKSSTSHFCECRTISYWVLVPKPLFRDTSVSTGFDFRFPAVHLYGRPNLPVGCWISISVSRVCRTIFINLSTC